MWTGPGCRIIHCSDHSIDGQNVMLLIVCNELLGVVELIAVRSGEETSRVIVDLSRLLQLCGCENHSSSLEDPLLRKIVVDHLIYKTSVRNCDQNDCGFAIVLCASMASALRDPPDHFVPFNIFAPERMSASVVCTVDSSFGHMLLAGGLMSGSQSAVCEDRAGAGSKQHSRVQFTNHAVQIENDFRKNGRCLRKVRRLYRGAGESALGSMEVLILKHKSTRVFEIAVSPLATQEEPSRVFIEYAKLQTAVDQAEVQRVFYSATETDGSGAFSAVNSTAALRDAHLLVMTRYLLDHLVVHRLPATGALGVQVAAACEEDLDSEVDDDDSDVDERFLSVRTQPPPGIHVATGVAPMHTINEGTGNETSVSVPRSPDDALVTVESCAAVVPELFASYCDDTASTATGWSTKDSGPRRSWRMGLARWRSSRVLPDHDQGVDGTSSEHGTQCGGEGDMKDGEVEEGNAAQGTNNKFRRNSGRRVWSAFRKLFY